MMDPRRGVGGHGQRLEVCSREEGVDRRRRKLVLSPLHPLKRMPLPAGSALPAGNVVGRPRNSWAAATATANANANANGLTAHARQRTQSHSVREISVACFASPLAAPAVASLRAAGRRFTEPLEPPWGCSKGSGARGLAR